MLAVTLINICARDYNDISFQRVAKDVTSSGTAGMANWLDWLNDAQKTVTTLRPDASSSTAALQLVSGARQNLPASAWKLLRATRNMGANGTTVGRTVRYTEQAPADLANRDWQTAAPVNPVREVFYDEKNDPTTFWVSPPQTTPWYIELITSRVPTDVPDPVGTNVISLPDLFAPAMQEWMLYRAYALSTQAMNQWQRAVGHFNAFFNLLGVKLKAEMFYAPRMGEGFPQVPASARG